MIAQSTALVPADYFTAALYAGDRDPIGRGIAALTLVPVTAVLVADQADPAGHVVSADGLTADQLDGNACVDCGLKPPPVSVPVGHVPGHGIVFACEECPDEDAAPAPFELHPGHMPLPLLTQLDRIPAGRPRVIFGADLGDGVAGHYAEHDGETFLLLPSGALLDQHRNIVRLVDAILDRDPIRPDDVVTITTRPAAPCTWGSTWGCVSAHGPLDTCEGPITHAVPDPDDAEHPLCEAHIQDFGIDPNNAEPARDPQVSAWFGGIDVAFKDPDAVAAFADRLDAFAAHMRDLGAQLRKARA